MSGLKMAKADPEEFERVMSFVRVMEALFESRSFFSNEEDWREWEDDDEDKKMLLAIEKEVKEEDGTDWNGDADNRLILYEFIKRKWRQANFSGSFGRIIIDAEVLIDNACDPDLDYLEFKPEIKAAMEEYEKKEELMEAARKQLMNELWHKGTDNPGNKHPYPVINPDTQEMAFAYYDQRFGMWEFDRDYNPGRNMLWLDIEKILPNLQEGGAQ
ncbi:MAG: hypothetical protein K5893_12805 [Prevotella sp.]|nr:hypothetical protein [Prevotella sp.]